MNRILRSVICFLALLLAYFEGIAQKFEWVNFFQGDVTQSPVSMSVDKDGNQYATFGFSTEILFGSINPGKFNIYQKGLVLKQNSEGKVLWHKFVEGTKNFQNVYPLSSRFNSKGNLMVFVSSTDDIRVGSDTIRKNSSSGTSYAYYVLEFNDTGKVIAGNHLIDGTLIGVSFNANKITSDQNDNLYISLVYSGMVKVFDSTGTTNLGSTSSGSRNIIFKFSRSGRKFEWATTLPYSNINVNSLKVDKHENVYAATYWSSTLSINFKGQTLQNPQTGTGAIFVWDKNGKDKSYFFVRASARNSVLYDIAAYDSNSIYVSGAYLGDSAQFDTLWKRNNKYGTYLFFAKYDVNGKVKWAKTEDTSYTTALIPYNYYTGMTHYQDKFIYLANYLPYHYGLPVIIDGQKYEANANGYGLNLKIDDRGNVLWGFRTLSPFSAMGTDQSNNFYFQGSWSGDTIRFQNFKAFPDGIDGYIGKTTDYAINRGEVYAGPYCAGDTILVPFTKIGDFDTSNFFIAELSDEFGNFDGKERELGRVKSTGDSTVVGILPLFKTASSGEYRIRIISSSPIVQSFYKTDKLRLLIYSRDKADPGPPESICYGDTFKLTTYGGTKWTWSPKFNMSDSTARQPLVWPLKDTRYQIIIADSSGCGAPDTAVKQILVRKPLNLTTAYSDTTVCDTNFISLPMKFEGGDTAAYEYRVYQINNATNFWELLSISNTTGLDTLHFHPKPTLNAPQKLGIVLDDHCTNLKDTAYLLIQLQKPSQIARIMKDTVLCFGTDFKINSSPIYPDNIYTWKWLNLNNDSVLSETDSLRLNATESLHVRLMLSNGCTGDTNDFAIRVNPPFKSGIFSGTSMLNDTAICYGNALDLKSVSSGGSGSSPSYAWYLDGKLVSGQNSLKLTSSWYPSGGGTKKLLLVSRDNCAPLGDSTARNITVLPAPKADFEHDTLCNRSNSTFTFTGSVPLSPTKTTYLWDFEEDGSSAAVDPSVVLKRTGERTVRLWLSSDNGCGSEISKNVVVKPASKADFSFENLCENDSVSFQNLSEDANEFYWDFGDNSSANAENVKHQFKPDNNSRTFNVTLIAKVNAGCSDTVVKSLIILEAPKADFTYGIACNRNPIPFTFTGNEPDSGVITNFTWDFNGEKTSNLRNPSHLYQNIGKKMTKLTLISSNGCTDEITKEVEVNYQAKADFNGLNICEKDSAEFANLSENATQFLWKFGDGRTSQNASPKHRYSISQQSSTYIVTLVAMVENGCSDSVSKAITVNKNPISDFTYFRKGADLELEALQAGNSHYKWKFGNVDSVITTSPAYTYPSAPNQNLEICLQVKNLAGCISETCLEATLSSAEIMSPISFRLYPNPSNGILYIELPENNSNVSIEIINPIGQVVLQGILSEALNKIDIPLMNGMYYLKLTQAGKSHLERIIIYR